MRRWGSSSFTFFICVWDGPNGTEKTSSLDYPTDSLPVPTSVEGGPNTGPPTGTRGGVPRASNRKDKTETPDP